MNTYIYDHNIVKGNGRNIGKYPSTFDEVRARTIQNKKTFDSNRVLLKRMTLKPNNVNAQTPQWMQKSLRFSQPGDRYEREADRIMAKVMNVQNSIISKPCTACSAKPSQSPPEENIVQTKGDKDKLTNVPSNSTKQIKSMLGNGRALTNTKKAFFGSRLGYDFSRVRIHTDFRSAEIAHMLSAKAFTIGNDIVFAKGQYMPETAKNKELLAHELAHVVQQSNGAPNNVIYRYDDPALWCNPLIELVDYERDHGKLGTLYRYHPASGRLPEINYSIPSIYGDIDPDWMFRMAWTQYPFMIASIITPSMAQGFGRLANDVLTGSAQFFWSISGRPIVEYVRSGSLTSPIDYLYQEANRTPPRVLSEWLLGAENPSLRQIFAPALALCGGPAR